jgi:hypothetical protein
MSRRGHRGISPPPGHRVAAPLAEGGLVVTVANKAGYGKEFDFAGLPVAEAMQRSLTELFAAQSKR